jgi:O-antigen ligase
MNSLLLTGIKTALVFLLWMPLIVTPTTLQPFGMAKALYARTLIEIAVALWLVLLIRNPNYRPKNSLTLIFFAGYVIVSFFAAAQGENFAHSIWSNYSRMLGVWDLLHWFLLAVVAASVLSPRNWLQLLNWNLIVVLVLSLMALLRIYFGLYLPFLTDSCRVQVTLGNPSFLAAILVVTTLVAVGLLTRSLMPAQPDDVATAESPNELKERRYAVLLLRVFWSITAISGLMVIFHTGTRGALIGLVAGAMIMMAASAAWGNRNALRPVTLAGVGLLASIVLLIVVDQTITFPVPAGCEGQTASARLIVPTPEEGRASIRLMAIEVGGRAFLERPLLGWGPENYDRVWEKLSSPSSYKHGLVFLDKAHNQIMEELVTKGALGLIVYLGLWTVIVTTLIRKRRPPREDVLAYAIVGALAGYFVQNLFLFDTPPTILQFVLLTSWVAGQRETGHGTRIFDTPHDHSNTEMSKSKLSPLATSGIIIAVTIVLSISIYSINYRPFKAAQMLGEAHRQSDMAERLRLAQDGYDAFPPMANWARRLVMGELNEEWTRLTGNERHLALRFATAESERAAQSGVLHPLLLKNFISILQLSNQSPAIVAAYEPLLEQMAALAPERVYTVKLKARQQMVHEDYMDALRIIEEYEEKYPWTLPQFTILKRAIQAAISSI